MDEVLKEITALGRRLCVDKHGNVFKKTEQGMKPLSKHRRKDGYEYVEVTSNGKRNKVAVHRLVAIAFHPNPNNFPQVNHKDGNPNNNQVDNLEWVSASENQSHSRYVLGNQTGFKDKPVVCIDTGEQFISTREAWRRTGVNYCHISECARGKRKTAGKMRWQYA